MATMGKKRTTRSRTAKPGASKAPAKRKRRVSSTAASASPKKRIAIAGKFYTQNGCARTKLAATNLAKSMRAKGKLARVVSNGKGYCVYTRG